MKELISRDSFCAPEIEIFQSVRRWVQENPEEDPLETLDAVRLALMSMQELLNTVRETSLVSPDSILDAIKTQTESRNMELKYRGFKCKSFLVSKIYQGSLFPNKSCIPQQFISG